MKLPPTLSVYNREVEQRRTSLIESEIASLTNKLSFVSTGIGAPAFVPSGRALYIRQDGGTNTTLYVYEGASWSAK